MIIKRFIIFAILFTSIVILGGTVPPHPQKIDPLPYIDIEEIGIQPFSKQSLPSNILVLRIEFENLRFDKTKRFGVEYPHDDTYFYKLMQHLKDYYHDASNGQYSFEYRLAETVYMANYMGYSLVEGYAADNLESVNRIHLINQLISDADADSINPIDFSLYDGIIVFRAGGGQESDIEGTNGHRSFSSSLISLSSLRNVLDPENDDYEGIPTSSGAFVSRMAFVPESQYHPYMDRDDLEEQFDVLGVLFNLFGRVIGIPTLSGNVSPTTAGAGNFCLMGTGIWNNNGLIPPMPSAWVRYYMGWETAIEIDQTTHNIPIAYPQSQTAENKLYKVNISDKEYFLIENRQLNFHKDFAPNGTPLFTFDWNIPDQDSLYIESSNFYLKMPNIMKNSLRGCEWDYFLPFMDYKTGSSPFYVEGSGLLIWHIDENIIYKETIIDGKPYTHLERNIINGDPNHRGVRLEEADGVYHLNSVMPDYYMRGSPFDSFREGNNAYFGKQINPDTGYFSLPVAESYYGGISFEICNISAADTVMTFAVRYEVIYDAESSEPNHHEVFVSESGELIYFQANGDLTMFQGGEKISMTVFPETDYLAGDYTLDSSDVLYFPVQDTSGTVVARLIKREGDRLTEVWRSDPGEVWGGPAIYNSVATKGYRWITYTDKAIYFLDNGFEVAFHTALDQPMLSNICEWDGILYHIQADSENDPTSVSEHKSIDYRIYSVQNHLFITEKNNNEPTRFYSIEMQYNTVSGKLIPFTSHFTVQHLKEKAVFDIDFPFVLAGQPMFKDITGNGMPEIILAHSNGFRVFTVSGLELHNVQIENPDFADNSGTGVVAWDWADDGKMKYFGGFSHNRLMFFDSDFQPIKSLSKVLKQPASALPFLCEKTGTITLFQPTEFGKIYTIDLPDAVGIDNLAWNFALGNAYRSAVWRDATTNKYVTRDTFVKGENYVYPSPWIQRYHSDLKFHIMTSVSTTVEVSIYNVAGQLVAEARDTTEAYVWDKNKFIFDPSKWASGVYFAVIKDKGKSDSSLKIKFAIER
ncbi:MAG: T9SS type A sorting domain-containing protein [Candidatus Cloacimonetes bacterium]|nr:T9SS type A sorting domain-containing protein [Candidatus Cloacimonadota bacterium]